MKIPFLSSSKKKQAQPDVKTDVPADPADAESNYKPLEWSLVGRLVKFLIPYWRLYAVGLAMSTCQVFLELLSPAYTQRLVNFLEVYTSPTNKPASLQMVDSSLLVQGQWLYAPLQWLGEKLGYGLSLSSVRAATFMVVAIVAVWAVTMCFSLLLARASILITTRAGESVQFDIRRKLFAHLQGLSMDYYDKTRLGRIISRCTSDINSMREVNVWGITQVVSNTLTLIIASIMLCLTDWRLFLSVVWLAPILYYVNHWFRKRLSRLWQEVREGFTRVSTNLAENITGVRVVTAFNRQEPNLARFNQLQMQNTANNVRSSKANGVYQPSLTMIGFLGRAIILVVGGYLLVTGRMAGHQETASVGAVIAALLYWDAFMNPLINLGNFNNQLMQALAGAERVFNLLDTQPSVVDVPQAMALPRIHGRVEFEHVTFAYRPDRPVLHDVNFIAEPGQTVALVGATGGGKSTIISLIARFYQPQEGHVLIDGHDVRNVIGHSLHKQMGLVLQVNYLFSGTVMDNIRYASPEATSQQVIAAAEAIGSLEAINRLPHAFDTQVGERGALLSLGQRQLICFTRAFLADPRIFMLDEATSSVDTSTELEVQHSLERLLANRTTFIVAHRLSTIQRADQILVVNGGCIVERGNHASLLEANGAYARLYEQFAKHTA